MLHTISQSIGEPPLSGPHFGVLLSLHSGTALPGHGSLGGVLTHTGTELVFSCHNGKDHPAHLWQSAPLVWPLSPCPVRCTLCPAAIADCSSVAAYGADDKLLPSGGSGLARDLAALRAQRSNGLQRLILPLSGHACAQDNQTHEESSPYATAASSPFLTPRQHRFDNSPHKAYSRNNSSVASPVLKASPRQHHRTVSNGAASGGLSCPATTRHVTPLPGVVPGNSLQARNAAHAASSGTAAGEAAASPRYPTPRACAGLSAHVSEPAPAPGPPYPGSPRSCGKLPSIGLSSPTSTSGAVHDSTAPPYCPSPVPKSRLGSIAGSDGATLQGGGGAAPTATPRPADGPAGREVDCHAGMQPFGAAQGGDSGWGGSTCNRSSSSSSRNSGRAEEPRQSGGVGRSSTGAAVVQAYVRRHQPQQQRTQRPAAAAIALTAHLQVPHRAASTGKAAPNATTLPSLPLSPVGAPQQATPKAAAGGTQPHAAAAQPTRRVVSSPFTSAAAAASATTATACAPTAMPGMAAARALSTPAPAAVLPVPPAVSMSPRGVAGAGQEGGAKLLAVHVGLPAAMQRERWRLDDYEVHKRIYKGGMSAVYSVRQGSACAGFRMCRCDCARAYLQIRSRECRTLHVRAGVTAVAASRAGPYQATVASLRAPSAGTPNTCLQKRRPLACCCYCHRCCSARHGRHCLPNARHRHALMRHGTGPLPTYRACARRTMHCL